MLVTLRLRANCRGHTDRCSEEMAPVGHAPIALSKQRLVNAQPHVAPWQRWLESPAA